MTGGGAVGWEGSLVLQGGGSQGDPLCVHLARESHALAGDCSIYFEVGERRQGRKKVTYET